MLWGLGLTPEDYEQDVDIWPDSVQAFDVFRKVGTQWRVGMGGPIGLDHNVLYREVDRLGLTPKDSDALMDDIRVMEIEALEALAVRNEKPK